MFRTEILLISTSSTYVPHCYPSSLPLTHTHSLSLQLSDSLLVHQSPQHTHTHTHEHTQPLQKQNGHGATSTVFICRNKETQKQYAAKRVDKKKMIAMVRNPSLTLSLVALLLYISKIIIKHTHTHTHLPINSMHINKDRFQNVWLMRSRYPWD